MINKCEIKTTRRNSLMNSLKLIPISCLTLLSVSKYLLEVCSSDLRLKNTDSLNYSGPLVVLS